MPLPRGRSVSKPFRLIVGGDRVRTFSRLQYAKQAAEEKCRRWHYANPDSPFSAEIEEWWETGKKNGQRAWRFNGVNWSLVK